VEFEFRIRYRERLDKHEDEIHRDLIRLSKKYPGQRLILLCWEDLRKPNLWCHRTIAAEWLGERGVDVPEMTSGLVPGLELEPKKPESKPKPWQEDTLFEM
jgi:hypothetical protein